MPMKSETFLYYLMLNSFVQVTNLAVTVGIMIELTIHYMYAFSTTVGESQRFRVISALEKRLGAEAQGLITLVVSVIFILAAPLAFIRRYYFGMLLSMAFISFFNGVCLLPILLFFIGPTAPNAEAEILDQGGSSV